MKLLSSRHITTLAIIWATSLFLSCREVEVEPMIAAGYIDAASSTESIVIKGDTIGVRHFAIDEQTLFEGGEIVEGNIAEVIYMPSLEDGELPYAITVTTDETYPKALGRWTTEPKAPLKIDLELKPRGRITQHQPEQTIHFTSWQLAGKENEILLYGVISLPPDWSKKSEKPKKGEEPIPPTRRERSFKVRGTLTKQADSNTESRPVIIIRTQKGRESRLYLQE